MNIRSIRAWVPVFVGLTAGAGLLSVAAAQPQAAPPIQVPTEAQLAEWPRMTGFQLSPDGKSLLAMESKGDVRTILVWKVASLGEKPTVLGSSAMRIESASFLKNDVLAVRLSQPYDARIGDEVTKTFINKLMVTDIEGKNWREPLESSDLGRSEATKRLRALAVPTILNRMPSDPDHVIVESDGTGSDRDLFRYNVRTGSATRLMRLSESDGQVLVDGTGRPRAKTRGGIDAKGAFVATDIRNLATGAWEEHFKSYVKDRDIIEIVGLGASEGTLVLRSNVGRETSGLYEYDPKERKKAAVLFEHRFFDALTVRKMGALDASSVGAYDGFGYNGVHGNEVHWENPRFEGVVKGVAKSLGIAEAPRTLMEVVSGKAAQVTELNGASVTITAFRDGEVPMYLLRVSGLAYPTEHYLLRGPQMTLLARERPQVDRRALGTPRFVYYKARDGLSIPAILTTPNRQLCGEGPYAAVVHPHGGPWARDDMDYDGSGWVPLLVSRCHAVLQPQFRGSADWGRALWLAGDAEWGQKMQDDKDDGAKWLIAEKIADPKRIALFGFSYGGYAAFAAAVRPNDLYKCAIAGAGVSDIERIWAQFYTNPFFRERQEPTVRGLSPLKQADKIKIPMMVYHGDRDQTVPLVQSELFVDKAKASGQPVEYHVLKDYAHGPAAKVEIQTRQLQLISGYLKSGCGGGL